MKAAVTGFAKALFLVVFGLTLVGATETGRDLLNVVLDSTFMTLGAIVGWFEANDVGQLIESGKGSVPPNPGA